MAIVILEDQIFQSKALQEIIEEQLQSLEISNETIWMHTRPDELLLTARRDHELNLFFLDIQIKKDAMSGLEVAREIRKFDEQSLLVFVSTHSEFVMTSYKYMVSALQFIEKRTDLETFKKEVQACVATYLEKKASAAAVEDCIVIPVKNSMVKIAMQEVLYFQTLPDHRVSLMGRNSQREFYGTLASVEKLHTDLIKCHHSCIVNKKYVMELDAKHREITMINGHKLPVSRRYYREIKELLTG